MKSIKLSEYFQLVKPSYVYIQIIPHKSIRNYNSSNIAKAIAHTYRAINRRIYKKQKKLFFETVFKISYIIDIKNGNANFYFLVPDIFKNIIIEKCKEIWSKATINILESKLEEIESAEMYSLSYKKEDAMSLQVDKKSNEPLNSILSVMDIMKAEDHIRLIYNFQPNSQLGWLEKYTGTMEKIKQKKIIDKNNLTFEYMLRKSMNVCLGLMDSLVQVINDFTGGNPNSEKESLYGSILGILEQQGELSPSTRKKKESTILNTQIAVLSSSADSTRRENNALSICQSFRTLDEDNELIYKKVKLKDKFDIESHDYNIDTSTFSTDECSNFIQVPGRLLLLQHRINHINIEENQVPVKLQTGIKNLGISTFKGVNKDTFLDTEWNSANTSLTCVGGQGAGKSTFISNYCRDCINANEGVIVIDFIKNCEMSEDIARVTPKEKLVKINLAKETDIQSFAYNEMQIKDDMTVFQKTDLASMQSEQLMSLIDAISIGEPLSSGMRRVFNSASTIVSIQGFSSLKNTIECLENHVKRVNYINGLSADLKDNLEEEINTLEELNEYDKKTGEIVGTKSSKISFILDRVDLLRANFKLKYMYKANSDNNIDLKKCMDENKVVLIQMKDGDFPTKMQKNILVTYFITKIWLATQLRGMEHDKPNRINVIIDEVFQAPTSLSILEYILVQARKFALKPVLSIHYVRQIANIFEALQTSNGSFMLMKGSTEDDFKYLKNKIDNFEFEDLKDMKKYHSMNLICYSDGYSSFITKLPKPI